MCLQEHWLRDDQLEQFSNISSEFDAYAHSKTSKDAAPLYRGRPYGSLAILVKRSLFRVNNFGCSLDSRVQELRLLPSSKNIL